MAVVRLIRMRLAGAWRKRGDTWDWPVGGTRFPAEDLFPSETLYPQE